MNSVGQFIVVEGLDGVGKTTLVLKTEEFLNKNGHRAVAVRQPGSTEYAEALRPVLFKTKQPNEVNMFAMLSAVASLMTVIRNATQRGVHVICDRHLISTLVYNCFNEESTQLLHAVSMMDMFKPLPDHIIMVSCDPETLFKRINDRKGQDANHFDATTMDAITQRSLRYYDAMEVLYTSVKKHTIGTTAGFAQPQQIADIMGLSYAAEEESDDEA